MMYLHRHTVFILIAILIACGIGTLDAAESAMTTQMADLQKQMAEMQVMMKAMQENHTKEVQALKGEIAGLKRENTSSQNDADEIWIPGVGDSPPADNGGASAANKQSGRARLAPLRGGVGGKVFNPDISVNANFLAHAATTEGSDRDDGMELGELEIGISSVVDPYGRYDITLAVEREPATTGEAEIRRGIASEAGTPYGISVEEAMFTYTKLPGNLQLRLGRFRATLGKSNLSHRHALSWVDYPLVVEGLLGKEGLMGDGASLSWLIPNHWEHFMELTYEVFNNDNEILFNSGGHDDLTHVLHFKNFWDLPKNWTAELGLTGATGPDDGGHGGNRTWLEGADFTLKWKPVGKLSNKSFTFQSEAFWTQKDRVGVGDETDANAFGAYVSGDYQFARRWLVGARGDYAEFIDNPDMYETQLSSYLTFKQSEFSFWRLGYKYRDPNFGPDDSGEHQFLLQFNISFGAHPAHKY